MKRGSKTARSDAQSANNTVALVVGGETARGIAIQFDESAAVRFVTADSEIARRARSSGLDTHCLDVTSARDLGSIESGSDIAIVAEPLDRRTLLVAQLLRSPCDVEHVVAMVSDETYYDAFATADITLVRLDRVLFGVLGERVPQLRPAD